MRWTLGCCLLIVSHLLLAQESFQLAPPMLKYHSGFFRGTTSLEVIFDQPGTQLRYTLNGSEPTEKDPRYASPITITKKTLVKVKAFGKGYQPSETVSASFIGDGKTIKKVEYSRPNDYYANAQPNILHDNIGGIVNYRSGGWLGYDNDTVTLVIELGKPEKVNRVLVDLLQDENSWIFLPEKIALFYFNEKLAKYIPAGKQVFTHETKGPKRCRALEMVPARPVMADKLKLVISPLKKIPDWHNGKGNHGWLFIDEIKVY